MTTLDMFVLSKPINAQITQFHMLLIPASYYAKDLISLADSGSVPGGVGGNNYTLGVSNPTSDVFSDHDEAAIYYYGLYAADLLFNMNDFIGSNYYTSSNLVKFPTPYNDVFDTKVDKIVGKSLSTENYSTAEKSKLAGISTAATANDTDANLKARANHTGTQSVSTITGLSSVATTGDFNDLSNKPVVTKVYSGTTLKSAPVLYTNSATVSSGVVVFHITDTGLSGGNALFPNGPITTSLNAFVSDSAASYQMAGAWSNSNKTLTITTNKLGTANILTGILGQVAGNGSVVNVQVWGN